MKSKSIYGYMFLSFSLAVLSGMDLSLAQSVAAVKDPNQQVRNISSSVVAETDTSATSSQSWHTHLWESLPLEWLQDSSQGALLEAYEKNNWQPLFITSGFEIKPGAHLLLRRLENLQDEAIDPKTFNVEDLRQRIQELEDLRLALRSVDPSYRDSAADSSNSVSSQQHPQVTSISGAQYAEESSRLPTGTSAPSAEKQKLYGDIFRTACAVDVRLAHTLIRFANTMNPYSRELQISGLVGHVPMNEFLKEIEPPSLQYQSLVQALQKYQYLAEKVPQQQLIQSQKLSPGDAGNGVRDLQKRLQQEDFYHGKISGSFDETTKDAVQRFQLFHNLDADCKVGQQTREWLNVSFQDKADMIAQALKLYRQSQTRRYQRYVRINIPQFTLEYHNEGKIEAVHRVIVGKASGKRIKLNGRMMGENQTPTLTSTIEQVVINPRWYVSDRIRLELSREIAADPSYLERHGYVQMTSSRYPWGEPRLIQLPGPSNALGQVRFDFPNAYAVYMHDTPNKYLFHRARRDFSHGCIRVEKAHQLAQELLSADQNPAAFKTDSYLSTNRETFLKLREPVPIIIEYVPVIVNAKGDLVFCGDPYGWFQESSERKS
jgi:murein L,D-transpeptidase YcbB/YkuD